MKKVKLVFFLILLFVVSLSCFALTSKSELTTGFGIEGYVEGYHKVTIYSLSSDTYQGMPFDITGSDVKYNDINQNLGRVIAKWDFSTTYGDVKISIDASPMKYDDPSDTEVPELDYYISFKYKYVKYTWDENSSSLKSSDVSGYILACSDKEDTKQNPSVTLTNSTVGNNFPIISSSQQDIRFMFMEGENPTDKEYPNGSYSATVTITFTSVS